MVDNSSLDDDGLETDDDDQEDGVGDILGLLDDKRPASKSRSRNGIKDDYPTLDFMAGKSLRVHRAKVSCHMADGAKLMKSGFTNLVPISAYEVVLTKETRVDYPDSPMVEISYELAPLMSKSFDMETLFLVLDEVMEKLEDYSPHIELY